MGRLPSFVWAREPRGARAGCTDGGKRKTRRQRENSKMRIRERIHERQYPHSYTKTHVGTHSVTHRRSDVEEQEVGKHVAFPAPPAPTRAFCFCWGEGRGKRARNGAKEGEGTNSQTDTHTQCFGGVGGGRFSGVGERCVGRYVGWRVGMCGEGEREEREGAPGTEGKASALRRTRMWRGAVLRRAAYTCVAYTWQLLGPTVVAATALRVAELTLHCIVLCKMYSLKEVFYLLKKRVEKPCLGRQTLVFFSCKVQARLKVLKRFW